MFKTVDYIREKKRLNKGQVNIRLMKSNILDEIDTLLSANLTEDIEEFAFEVLPKVVSYVIAVIDRPPLSDKYIISQDLLDRCLFVAKMRDIDI